MRRQDRQTAARVGARRFTVVGDVDLGGGRAAVPSSAEPDAPTAALAL